MNIILSFSGRKQWISKSWGGEDILVNCADYCGKVLYFMQDHRASFHFHEIKKESFYVLEGKVLILYASPSCLGNIQKNKDNIAKSIQFAEHKDLDFKKDFGIYDAMYGIQYSVLEKGNIFHIDRQMCHQAIALMDSKIIEFSTHSEDSDSFRIVTGF